MDILTELQRVTQSSNPYKTAVTAGLSGNIKPGLLRSIYWRIFLGILPTPRSKPSSTQTILEKWDDEMHAIRKKYLEWKKAASGADKRAGRKDEAAAAAAKKKTRFGDSDSDSDDEDVVKKENPLSTHAESTYAKKFQRQKVEEIVAKDMGRLWSDDPFFEDDTVRANMQNILLDYCCPVEDESCPFFLEGCTGQGTGYRQGMHEILSLIFYVVHRDAETVAAVKPTAPLSTSSGDDDTNDDDFSILQSLCSKSSVVSDSFIIFAAVMSSGNGLGLVEWYHGTVSSPKGGVSSPTSLNDGALKITPNEITDNIVVDVANDIQLSGLKQLDEALWRKLNKELDIQPTSYLLRWLRLLFLREFSFSHASLIWDAVLAEYSWRKCEEGEQSYKLGDSIVPDIALSMLLYVSSDLMGSDYSYALRRLMRYPPVEDTRPIISKSIERRHRGSRLALLAGVMPSAHPKPVASATPVPAAPVPVTSPAPAMLPPPSAMLPPPSGSMLPAATPHSTAPPPLSASFAPSGGSQLPPPLSQPRGRMFEAESIASLRDRQIRQGMGLASVIKRLEAKWFPPAQGVQTEEEKARVEDDYLVAIAELKKIRDVLLNGVSE